MENRKISVAYKGLDLEISALIKDDAKEWLVLLHGIQSNKELFAGLLKQSFVKSYSCLAIDAVGFGGSSKPENFSYDLQDQANIVEQIVRQLGIKKLHLVGHSLGGMVATLLLKPLENIVASFVNMEGNLVYADCGLSKIVAEYNFEDFKNEKYAKVKSDIASSQEPSGPQRTKWLKLIPDLAFYRTSVSIVEWSKSETLLQLFKNSSARKLFMYGDQNSGKADILPSSIERAEIPHAGHFMLLDNPQASYEAIRGFLAAS